LKGLSRPDQRIRETRIGLSFRKQGRGEEKRGGAKICLVEPQRWNRRNPGTRKQISPYARVGIFYLQVEERRGGLWKYIGLQKRVRIWEGEKKEGGGERSDRIKQTCLNAESKEATGGRPDPS